ncbi:MAG TPA: hypothetical protein VLJ37_03770 [bacterium]|nr:hypothetical protein [bacterium]
MNVAQATNRLNMIVKSGGPQAEAAREILNGRSEGGAYASDSAFIAAVEGLPSRFGGDAATGLNSRVALFRDAPVSSQSLTPNQSAFVDYVVMGVNLSFENSDARGPAVLGTAERLPGVLA